MMILQNCKAIDSNVGLSFTCSTVLIQSFGMASVPCSAPVIAPATEAEESSPSASGYVQDDFDYPSGLLPLASEDFQERLQDITVADFMTEGVVHVTPSTPISELARTIRENKIHRLLVVENGTLRGIVSTFDLVTLLEQSD